MNHIPRSPIESYSADPSAVLPEEAAANEYNFSPYFAPDLQAALREGLYAFNPLHVAMLPKPGIKAEIQKESTALQIGDHSAALTPEQRCLINVLHLNPLRAMSHTQMQHFGFSPSMSKRHVERLARDFVLPDGKPVFEADDKLITMSPRVHLYSESGIPSTEEELVAYDFVRSYKALSHKQTSNALRQRSIQVFSWKFRSLVTIISQDELGPPDDTSLLAEHVNKAERQYRIFVPGHYSAQLLEASKRLVIGKGVAAYEQLVRLGHMAIQADDERPPHAAVSRDIAKAVRSYVTSGQKIPFETYLSRMVQSATNEQWLAPERSHAEADIIALSSRQFAENPLRLKEYIRHCDTLLLEEKLVLRTRYNLDIARANEEPFPLVPFAKLSELLDRPASTIRRIEKRALQKILLYRKTVEQ